MGTTWSFDGSSGASADRGKLRIGNTIAGTKYDYLTIVNVSGNVGIGTTSPTHTLNVVGTGNITGHCVAENSMISMADGSKKKVVDVKSGDEVLSLDEKTGKIVSNKVKALLDMGEKPIYELCTESGKCINTTSEHPYLVKVNAERDCKNYENDVWNKEYNKFNGEYCKRWISVGNLKNGMEIAVQDDSLANFSDNCFVEIETPISNNLDSYVQSGDFSNKDKATNSSSFGCSFNNCFALGIKDLYFFKGTNSILFNINEDNNLNSSLDNFDLDRISFSFLRNSCLSFSGANNCNLSLKIISKISPEEINVLKSTFASRTAFIYYNPLFKRLELIDNLTLSENLSASCSVNLDFDTMSLTIENCNSLIKESTTFVNAKLNSCLNSAGISNLIVISSMLNQNSKEYLNVSSKWVKVKELEKGDYIAIPNLLSISLGDNTSTEVLESNFFNTLSPEKIGHPSFNASARYCTSFRCSDKSFSPFRTYFENSDFEIKVICSNINSKASSNSSLDNLDFLENSSLCFSSSVNKNSGATKSNLLNIKLSLNTSDESHFVSNEERMTLTSTTIFIFNHSKYLFDNALFILSDNSSTSSSVNLDLETILWKCTDLSNFDLINLLANMDHSMFGICLIENSNSSGIFTDISAINEGNSKKYLNVSNNDFYFDKIASIKQHPAQHVYDLAIENTHNFIANDIIAHNTYVGGNLNVSGTGTNYFLGNVGIGTTSPTYKLQVNGTMNVSSSNVEARIGESSYVILI